VRGVDHEQRVSENQAHWLASLPRQVTISRSLHHLLDDSPHQKEYSWRRHLWGFGYFRCSSGNWQAKYRKVEIGVSRPGRPAHGGASLWISVGNACENSLLSNPACSMEPIENNASEWSLRAVAKSFQQKDHKNLLQSRASLDILNESPQAGLNDSKRRDRQNTRLLN
jgi:hypothetical protein